MDETPNTAISLRLPAWLETPAVAATAFVCYLTHLAPFDVVALTWMPLFNALIVLALVITVKLLLARKLPRLHRTLAVVYYVAVGAWAALLSYYVIILDGVFFVMVLAFVTLMVWVLYRRRENRFLLFMLLAIATVYAFSMPYRISRVAIVIAVLVGGLGAMFAPPRRIGRPALLFAATIILLISRLGTFYFGSEPNELRRALDEPRLEPVLTLQDITPDVWQKNFALARFAADNMAGTYTLVGNANSIIALPTGRADFKNLAEHNAGDSVLYDIQANHLIFAEAENQRINVVDDRTLDLIASVHEPGRVFTNLYLDPAQRLVYTGDDFTGDIGVFKLDDFTFDRFIPATASRDALRDEQNNVLIATTWGRVRWIDLKTDTVRYSMWTPDFEIRLAIDAPRRRLYLSLPSLGEIRQIDLDNPRVLKTLKLAPGVRFMRLSDDRRMLFVAGYFDGYLYQIRVPEMELHRKVFVGSRVRSLHIAPGDDRVVCASSLGVFRFKFR